MSVYQVRRGSVLRILATATVLGCAHAAPRPSEQPATVAPPRDVAAPSTANGGVFDVRAFGAKGDGHTIDSDAINRAIDAAAAAGGGTVVITGGTYASHSIRLKSHVKLHLG